MAWRKDPTSLGHQNLSNLQAWGEARLGPHGSVREGCRQKKTHGPRGCSSDA